MTTNSSTLERILAQFREDARNSMRFRCFIALALVLALCLTTRSPAWAWGSLGHRLTARLAEKHLTPETLAAVKALLDDGETIAAASLWADQHKREIRGSAPWHYVKRSSVRRAAVSSPSWPSPSAC